MDGQGEILLQVEGVSLRLSDLQVLEGLTFQVRDRVRPEATTGQVVSLLGPSGVGKTRLIRIIAGLDQPDSGSVRGRGGAALEAGSVGVVFQNYLLLRHRTVSGNLLLAGRIAGLSDAEARHRAETLLARFGLGTRGDAYPAQLSGGQRQRVAIAQQLMGRKTLLLMDEPFSGLDPAALDNVIALINEVAHTHEHNTIMLVTHDIRAAMTVSDTIYMLGRDRGQGGQVASGARVQATYDLVQHGLAWREGAQDLPEFAALEREIRGRFKTL
jgi:polar amino acid transport system ATP-binding protein/sulfate transport system ATP-binding protein